MVYRSEMIKKLIQEYQNKLPQKLLEYWDLNGFATLSNDFIKVVNPNDYKEILNESYESPALRSLSETKKIIKSCALCEVSRLRTRSNNL